MQSVEANRGRPGAAVGLVGFPEVAHGSTAALDARTVMDLTGTIDDGVLAAAVAVMAVQSERTRLEAVEWVAQQDLRPKMSALAAILAHHMKREQLHMSVMDSSLTRRGPGGPEALSPATREAVRYPRRWLMG
jgi:hypothetical protein